MSFYSLLYNAEKFERIEFPKPQVADIKQEIAPYNGFGSVEDSMASCLNLIPKAPRRYVLKMFIEIPEFTHVLKFLTLIGTLSSLCKGIAMV